MIITEGCIYKFRSYYEYSFDISVLKETGIVDLGTTYYTLGMNFFIHEGLPVTVVDHVKGWVKIQFPNGWVGWLAENRVIYL